MGHAKRTEEERLVKESKKGIMADPTERRSRFPGSRDWDLEGKISCANKKCICHKQSFGKGVCLMPSRCAIDSHGKCTGFQPKPKDSKTKEKRQWQ